MNVENIAYNRAVGTGKGAQGPQIAFRRVNMPLIVFGESMWWKVLLEEIFSVFDFSTGDSWFCQF